MQVIGHKGKMSYQCHVRGDERIRAWPEGRRRRYAAELIAYLKGMARRIQQEGPFDAYDIKHTTVHTGTVQGAPRSISFQRTAASSLNSPLPDMTTANSMKKSCAMRARCWSRIRRSIRRPALPSKS